MVLQSKIYVQSYALIISSHRSFWVSQVKRLENKLSWRPFGKSSSVFLRQLVFLVRNTQGQRKCKQRIVLYKSAQQPCGRKKNVFPLGLNGNVHFSIHINLRSLIIWKYKTYEEHFFDNNNGGDAKYYSVLPRKPRVFSAPHYPVQLKEKKSARLSVSAFTEHTWIGQFQYHFNQGSAATNRREWK